MHRYSSDTNPRESVMRPNARSFAFLSAAFVLVTSAAHAGTLPATGLGQAWPNAADVSASPRFHVYVFQRAGVRYVQVNDGAGTVRGAVAVVDGETLDLPVGVDANRWSATPATSAASGETVYRDDSVSIAVSPQPDGTMRLMAAPGDCTDPAKCSKRDN